MTEVFRSGALPTANTGLLYDRYADIWSGRPNWRPREGERKRFLKDVMKQAEVVEQDEGEGLSSKTDLLEGLHRRHEALWMAVNARKVEVQLSAPLVSGLGMSHTLDVGFSWDRNLGVPYLPASGLKGVARAWACQWEGLDATAARRIFGDIKDTGAGSIIFHALYPLTPPPLRVDVLNPHFQPYYEARNRGDATISPGDWMSPKPVFFLTTSAGTRFITAVQPRSPGSVDDLDLAANCLREALANVGAGGKTAIGYGIFEDSLQ